MDDLQKQLDIINSYLTTFDMSMNANKTNIVINPKHNKTTDLNPLYVLLDCWLTTHYNHIWKPRCDILYNNPILNHTQKLNTMYSTLEVNNTSYLRKPLSSIDTEQLLLSSDIPLPSSPTLEVEDDLVISPITNR
jgi:hypothetical protein